MAYDPARDKELKRWQLNDDLAVAVHQYDGGEPKLGFHRTYEDRRTGERMPARTGRLSREEVIKLSEVLPEIIETIENA